jgi:glycosyltransferase involved in cell wall biosynthesis
MERCAINLSIEFSARGWDVRSVFLETPRSPKLLEWARAQGFAAESSPSLLSYYDKHTFPQTLALRRLIASTKADIVHLHAGSNFLSLKDVLAARLSGRRSCVASIHSAESWHDGNLGERRKTRVAAALCDALIVHSKATRQVLLDAGVPARKVHLAPLGVHSPPPTPRADARARLGVAPEAFVVSTNARLVPHKGIADHIEAVARVTDPERTLHLIVAGDGPERASLEALADRRLRGKARFLGHVSDHADLYAASDLFALPAHDAHESFGLVFIEAALHGVPSIGTRVGGIPEAILDGETGLLVSPHAPDQLATAIERLRSDPALRARLGEAALARARAAFTIAQMTDRYQEVYETIARRSLVGRAAAGRVSL